ncbi:MAG: 3'(2'),5'-bisphosphate nucleotidase [Phycisphaeraceae bacterium]|nr:3'(2'),5'-bisphosphate nucleotidase [Phycisphaeraceae bacterium]
MKLNLDREIQVAIDAVRHASQVCRSVQQRLATVEALSKKDKSPVTVADFASQAVVCSMLMKAFPDDTVVAEEGTGELRETTRTLLRGVVCDEVRKVFGGATDEEVLTWIEHGATGDGHEPRFWTLDPIDGTKGFLRGEQYAVALALLEKGKVVLGALACPNLKQGDVEGVLLVVQRGQGTRLLSLWDEKKKSKQIKVSRTEDVTTSRFCESVESGHSDQDASSQIAQRLGISSKPLRMDSQAKYAALAAGQAEIYLRLPTRADYCEKIWDHAAGMIAVEEAGGRVTDIDGNPLDFTQGKELRANRGVVATNALVHEVVVNAINL